MKKKFSSRKFLLAILYGVILSVNSYFGFLTEDELNNLFVLFMTYIGVEGGRDMILANKLSKR
jgi:hypothetical protein